MFSSGLVKYLGTHEVIVKGYLFLRNFCEFIIIIIIIVNFAK